MRCEFCQGIGLFFWMGEPTVAPCPECTGCGIANCCEGIQAQPEKTWEQAPILRDIMSGHVKSVWATAFRHLENETFRLRLENSRLESTNAAIVKATEAWQEWWLEVMRPRVLDLVDVCRKLVDSSGEALHLAERGYPPLSGSPILKRDKGAKDE